MIVTYYIYNGDNGSIVSMNKLGTRHMCYMMQNRSSINNRINRLIQWFPISIQHLYLIPTGPQLTNVNLLPTYT